MGPVSAEPGTGSPADAGPAADPRDMKWWGWGDPAHRGHLPESSARLLAAGLGLDGHRHAPVALEEVRLPAARLPRELRDRLAAAAGAGGLRDDREARVLHAAGKSYPDLVRQRQGDCEQAPDAVVYPGSHDEVRAVLELCAGERVAVVPFGGGTSVVGGVQPVRDGLSAVVCLDLRRLDRLVSVDRASLTAVMEPGVRGPEAERRLSAHGLTLGHFPQSFEYASVGGFVATRSAGQASTGYGRIDELVLGLRCATPTGDVELPPLPASAAGPQVRELFVGSEGTLGVITEVALRVRPAPEQRRYDGWFFRSFAEGAEALRALEQAQAAPDIARVSDEAETALSMAGAGRSRKTRAAQLYLRVRGYSGGSLGIAGWEGERDEVARRRARGAQLLRRAGGAYLGAAPGRAWEANRFSTPYLRDELLEHGVMVETLETAAQWSDLMGLYAAVADALRRSLSDRGTPPIVGCHVSHLYPSGASLYFTFLARQQRGEEIDQWRAAKRAAGQAIAAAGGTITHHHAVGTDHVPWMEDEIGPEGLRALAAVKRELDPEGVMNPGKLLPAP